MERAEKRLKGKNGDGKKIEVPTIELPPTKYSLRECKLLDKVPSDLTCTICLEVFIDPVQCNGGGHLYCRECILPVAKKAKARCPIGGQSCNALSVAKLTVVPALVRNSLNALKVKCPLKNCEWNGAFETLETHLKACTYRLVKCEWCKSDIAFNVVGDHGGQCKSRPVECEHCGLSMNAGLLDVHLNNACEKNPLRMVPCVCGKSVEIGR